MKVKELLAIFNKYYKVIIGAETYEDQTAVPTEVSAQDVIGADFLADDGDGERLLVYTK